MQTKKYTQNAALIQWAYLFEDVRPLKTSTCALFWRSAVVTPLKILGPTAICCFFALVIFMLVAHSAAPEWAIDTLPQWMLLDERPSHPTNWVPVYVVGTAAVLVFLVRVSGLWGWFHALCIPVEIEGGLVKRGSCPKCVGTMVESSPDLWICRHCEGRFQPPPVVAEAR